MLLAGLLSLAFSSAQVLGSGGNPAAAVDAITGVDRTPEESVSADMGQQDKALKMAPKDKAYMDPTLDKPNKFSAPKKVPGDSEAIDAAVVPVDPALNAEKGSKGSVILDDYDPTRLGVSADEAKSSKDKEKNKELGGKEISKPDPSPGTKFDPKLKADTNQGRKAATKTNSHGLKTSSANLPSGTLIKSPSEAKSLAKPVSTNTAVKFSSVNAVSSAAVESGIASASFAHTLSPNSGLQNSPKSVVITPSAVVNSVAAATSSSPVIHQSQVKDESSAVISETVVNEEVSHKTPPESPKDAADQLQSMVAAVDEEGASMSRILGTCAMIILSELGDKTFFIAALMSMRHHPWFVYSASFLSLGIMTVLSIFLGMVLPSLLSQQVTTLLASILFVIFGIKLLREGWSMNANEDTLGEMHEVEQELELRDTGRAQEKAEAGGLEPKRRSGPCSGISNLIGLVISPMWIQIFAMTFLAEWGDRSQVATVALGAGSHYIDVLIGTLTGHALCTGIAIMGGKLLATRLSLRTITLGGGVCFLAFAIVYFSEWLKRR